MTATGVRFDVEAERRKLGAMTAGELRRRYQEIGGILLTTVVHRLHLCQARQDDGRLPGLDQRLAGPRGPRAYPGPRRSACAWQPWFASRPTRGRVGTEDRRRSWLPLSLIHISEPTRPY